MKTIWHKTLSLTLNILGKLWNSPNTIIGFSLGTIGLLAGGRKPYLSHNAIVFENFPFFIKSFSGLCIGNVILIHNQAFPTTLEHEQAHTCQGQILGPFYLPAHLLDWIIHRGYKPTNFLERGPYSNPPRPW